MGQIENLAHINFPSNEKKISYKNMKEFKYIIVESEGIRSAILFENVLSHKYIATNKVVYSAGFFSVDTESKSISVWGKSTTLDISSKQEDKLLIERVVFPEKAIW